MTTPNVTPEPHQPPRGTAAKEEILVALLASGATYAEAGEVAGLSERQVVRKMHDPAFRGRVNDLRNVLVSFAFGRLCKHVRDAADRLHLLAQDRRRPDGDDPLGVPFQTQAMAAKAVLELCLKVREATELTDRVKALEDRVSAVEG